MALQDVPLSKIRTDGATQMRAGLNDATVREYKAEVEYGSSFPAVALFFDGTDYWPGDGFHRIAAHLAAGKKKIQAVVKSGTRRDAILHAAGANATHGLPRTNADKRRAVETLLADEEWGKWSDREIARRCSVSHEFVRQLRSAICQPLTDRTVNRGGSTYQQKTENIGNPQPAPVAEDEEGCSDSPEDEDFDPFESVDAARPRKPGPQTPPGPPSAPGPAKATGPAVTAAPAETKGALPETGSTAEPGPTALDEEGCSEGLDGDEADDRVAAKLDAGKPWEAFNKAVRGHIRTIRAARRELAKVLDYDAKTKQIRSPFARAFSFTGSLGAVDSVIRYMMNAMPVEESKESPGYLSVGRAKLMGKFAAARADRGRKAN